MEVVIATTTIGRVRVDEQIKAQATETLAAMELTVSDAVRVFLMRVVTGKQTPFAPKFQTPKLAPRWARRTRLHTRAVRALGLLPYCSMTSEKSTASKRTVLLRAADYAKSFLKDRECLSWAERYEMNRLKEAILLLIANGGRLRLEWLDHSLGSEGKDLESVTSAAFSSGVQARCQCKAWLDCVRSGRSTRGCV